MTSKIFIATDSAGLIWEHLYLVYDVDGDTATVT